MRTVLAIALLTAGCVPPELGDYQGFEEVAGDWGFGAENARGVCLFDADGDADPDVLVTRADGLRYYRNLAPGAFADATLASGLPDSPGDSPAGCGAADLDGDGDRDVVITCNRDLTRLFLNDGAGQFVDATDAWGLTGWGQSSVTFEDVDRDGRLDVLLAGARDGHTQLLRNAGGRLEDRTPAALQGVEHSWGGVLFDADGDDLPDLFLGTDGTARETPDVLLLGAGDFSFSAVASSPTNTLSAMGVALADPDADGDLDLFVTNIGPRPLWQNQGDGTFVDLATATGLAGDRGETAGWGTTFLDMDDDGHLELFEAHGGFSLPVGTLDAMQRKNRERNRLFVRRGGDEPVAPGLWRYADAAAQVGLDDDGSALGAARGDLDGDGLVDLVVANDAGGPLRVYRNRGSAGDDPGRLRLRLHPLGDDLDGYGARVRLDACGRRQESLVTGGPSVFSQGETVIHFGLGGCTEDVVVTLRWPDGTPQQETIAASRLEVYDGPIPLVQGVQ